MHLTLSVPGAFSVLVMVEGAVCFGSLACLTLSSAFLTGIGLTGYN